MRALIKKINMFCYRHPRFGIPNLMLLIVIGNAAVWLFGAMDTSGLLERSLMFSAQGVLHGQIWRLVTFVFVPGSSGLMLLLFLYLYYFIGSSLEREWGSGLFTIYYLMGMLLTVIYGFISYFVSGADIGLTAQYINLSMFFAFATLFPDVQLLLFFIIPIKIKWLGIIDALFFVYRIFACLGAGLGMMSFLPLIAVINYFVFCGDMLLSAAGFTAAGKKKTVSFRREAKRIMREQKDKPYTYRCAVCGRTDVTNPELEFRYCSRCAGYHCFCEDHINNHVHFTE